MEYTEVKCRNCGHSLKVPYGAPRIRCEYCDTEYILSSVREEKTSEIHRIDYAGRGPLYQAYIPNGWSCRVTDDNSVSTLAAVCKALQLQSPEGARLIFLPFAYYKDYTPGSSLPGMGPRDYQLDPRSLVCYRRMVPLSQYAVERISAICGVPQIQMRPCSGELLQKKALLFQQEASQKLEKNVLTETGKFQFRFQQNNMVYDGYFATILAKAPKESSGGSPDVMDLLKKGMAFMGAMYGIGGMESFDWGRSFDLLLVYPHVEKDSYEVIFDKFLAELRYAPLYFALQDEELRNTQQIQIQGAMQRQQNAIRSSQQISRTLSETSDIVNQGIHDHSRQMDRIYDRSSDGIRGVNTYTDSTGRGYEADVGYEHIYRHNDTFVGSKDGSLQLGPEWEELERH